MHFSVCKRKKVTESCPYGPHGHLWVNESETQMIATRIPMMNKRMAMEAIGELVGGMAGREYARRLVLSSLEAAVEASNLPENEWDRRTLRVRSSNLKLVK